MTLEDFFLRIETQFNNKLPFVAYRKPNGVEVKALLQTNDDVYKASDFTERGFIFSPFDDAKETVLLPLKESELLNAKYVMSNVVETFHPTFSSSEKQKQDHINLVKKGVESIKKGAFKKVVLSRQEIVTLSESNPILKFKNLLNTYVSAFVYCWYHPKVGLWLGATPETLIKVEGNRFSMMALAGTQDYNGTLDVVWQQKEKQEQLFVTDFIIENLTPSIENLKISETETVKAGNLLHLRTNISAHLLKDSNLKDIISALHPTPAVCGLPKQEAKVFIKENEDYNRAFYTGFLGELNFEVTITPRTAKRNIENRAYTITRKSTQLYVNLRCMQIKNKKAIIYVGGGITKSSNPEKEWQETVSKSLVIKNAL